MKTIAIVGYGSIGKRHYKNFTDLLCKVCVVSRRTLEEPIEVYSSVEACLKQFVPDVIFICNETSEHSNTLLMLREAKYRGLIIVEKPLSVDQHKLDLGEDFNNRIKISYNLRFNPLLLKLKRDLESQLITSVVCYVGQYLPNWRRSVDYRQSYSAHKEKGGGVVLDLSHELDFCTWLFGSVTGVFAHGGKLSDLEITSEDTVAIITSHLKAPTVAINLNYTDRITNRFLIVNTNEKTIKLDFIKKTYHSNDTAEVISFDTNDSYVLTAKNIIEKGGDDLASYSEAVELMSVVENIFKSMKESKWISL